MHATRLLPLAIGTFALTACGNMGAVSGSDESHYVKGIGLAHETIPHINTTNVLLQKNHTSFIGLTPQ